MFRTGKQYVFPVQKAPTIKVGTGFRRQVAVTCRGDTSQRQIASWVLGNFCQNLRLCDRILSQQHVARNQIKQNLCDSLRHKILLQLQGQDFHNNSPVHTKRSVAPQQVAACTYGVICRCDLSPSVFRALE